MGPNVKILMGQSFGSWTHGHGPPPGRHRRPRACSFTTSSSFLQPVGHFYNQRCPDTPCSHAPLPLNLNWREHFFAWMLTPGLHCSTGSPRSHLVVKTTAGPHPVVKTTAGPRLGNGALGDDVGSSAITRHTLMGNSTGQSLLACCPTSSM